MPSSYTPSLRLVLPVEGELDGTWGDAVNNGITSLVDSAIAGSANIAMSDADYTLTVVDEAPDQARQMFINLTGTLSTTRNVICPAVSKLYIVHNATTQSIVFRTPSGSGITVLTATRAALYCNGTNVVDAVNALPAGTLVGGVAVVTPAATQTFTNKTISADDNTISGIAASSFVLSNGSGNLDGSAAQKAIPAGVVVGTTDTQTLANKRITARVNAQTTVASPFAWNSDSFDQQEFTALANALTISADAGTPTDGQKTIFRFQDNGTARALTWTTGSSKSFRAIGVTLPTTTVINKTIYVGCIYNSGDARWDAVAVVQEV
jgi:hypothetical protein